jgi:hypothetical protein
VSRTPGFPRALTRTIQELRLAGVSAEAISQLPLGGGDLATLLQGFDEQFAAASSTDRATLFAAAEAEVAYVGRHGSAAGAMPTSALLLDISSFRR